MRCLEYRKFLDVFMEKHDILPKASRERLKPLQELMIYRIFQETGFLFVNYNNAGIDLLK